MTGIDIIVIGAGAAGLMAARALGKAGKKVLVLEARNRLGGRIHTQTNSRFSIPTETGAEFVHGDLSVTQNLLAEIKNGLLLVEGQSYQIKNGELQASGEFIADFDKLLEKINELQEDMPLANFLEQYLADEEFADLRNSVTRFAEGYDAADTKKVSTFALRDEWQSGGAENSFHLQGGYGKLIEYLAAQCQALGGVIQLSTVVKEIKWELGEATIICNKEQIYQTNKVLITVPLGILQASPKAEVYISFNPELPAKRAAFKKLGFGAVIKILLEFKEAFWENERFAHVSRQLPELAFMFADNTPFTAWWTQLPHKAHLLTGWLAGPQVKECQHMPEHALVLKALEALAYIFKTTIDFLQTQLKASQVINWATDPYARGAYAYATLATPAAIKVISQPEQNTLFFAGEAFYEGHAMGTVEAALASGAEAASKILQES